MDGTDSRKNRAVAGKRTHRVLARVVDIRRCRRVAECLGVQFRVQAHAHPVLVDYVAKVADKPALSSVGGEVGGDLLTSQLLHRSHPTQTPVRE